MTTARNQPDAIVVTDRMQSLPILYFGMKYYDDTAAKFGDQLIECALIQRPEQLCSITGGGRGARGNDLT